MEILKQQPLEPRAVSEILAATLSLPGQDFGTSAEPEPDYELTEQEIAEALLKARQEKANTINQRRKMQEYHRQIKFAQEPWTASMVYLFAFNQRAGKFGFSMNGGKDGKPVYRLDANNETLWMLLSWYFAEDKAFETEQVHAMFGYNPQYPWKLDKGLLICGAVGTGKTLVMKLFASNRRCSYDVVNAEVLAEQYTTTEGKDILKQFSGVHRQQIKHYSTFYHEDLGVCIDDLGTDTIKNAWGNKCDVLATILINRYENKSLPWYMTHVTTNLGAKDLSERYGPRVWDRVKQMFNIIQMPGGSRR